MDEHVTVLAGTVRDLLRGGQPTTAAAVTDGLHSSDLAALLAALDLDERRDLLGLLAPEAAAPAVWELDAQDREETLGGLPDERLTRLLEALPDEGAADLLQDLETMRHLRLLGTLSAQRAESLRALLGHPVQSAGGIMSTRFVAVASGASVADAFDVLRAHQDTRFAYYVYVLDARGSLRGVTSLRDLLVAGQDTRVDDLCRREPVSVLPWTDQEEVARLASRYDLLAVPVVSTEGRMIGVVTADDVLEVLSTEADEDLERFAGSVEAEPGRRGLWPVVRARMPWVLGTFVVELVIANVFLRPLPAARERVLLAFLPLLLLTGGSAAISAAGVMLRRLVGGERRAVMLLVREVQGGTLLGLLAMLATAVTLLLAGQPTRMSSVVGISVGLTVLVSSTVGAAAPLVLRGVRRDPALASGPLLGGLADAASLAVYLLAARLFLGAR